MSYDGAIKSQSNQRKVSIRHNNGLLLWSYMSVMTVFVIPTQSCYLWHNLSVNILASTPSMYYANISITACLFTYLPP